MQDEPTPTELIKAVADFLRNDITPVIKGHNAFKLRVGINALDRNAWATSCAATPSRYASSSATATGAAAVAERANAAVFQNGMDPIG